MTIFGHVVTELDVLCGATAVVVALVWLQMSTEIALLRRRVRALEGRIDR